MVQSRLYASSLVDNGVTPQYRLQPRAGFNVQLVGHGVGPLHTFSNNKNY